MRRVAELGSLGGITHMNLSTLSEEDLLARCGWCHRRIPQDQECFGAGLRVRPERRAEIVNHEGRAVPLQLASGREIIVMVLDLIPKQGPQVTTSIFRPVRRIAVGRLMLPYERRLHDSAA
jgi:hypothetical protein